MIVQRSEASHEKIRWVVGYSSRVADLLSRTIHIDISPELDVKAVEEIAEGINKVLEAVI